MIARTTLLAAAAVLFGAVPVLAQTDSVTVTGREVQEDPYTIRVAYGDLDLANAAGAEMLRDRVRHVAHRTCSDLYPSATSQGWGCKSAAWSVAAPQIAAAIDGARGGQTLASGGITLRFARR